MGTDIVYLLVLLGYNSIVGEVNLHKEMSWHLSHSECRTTMYKEMETGRRPGYNQNYACLPVHDSAMRARAEHEENDHNYPRRHGSGGLILRWK